MNLKEYKERIENAYTTDSILEWEYQDLPDIVDDYEKHKEDGEYEQYATLEYEKKIKGDWWPRVVVWQDNMSASVYWTDGGCDRGTIQARIYYRDGRFLDENGIELDIE